MTTIGRLVCKQVIFFLCLVCALSLILSLVLIDRDSDGSEILSEDTKRRFELQETEEF